MNSSAAEPRGQYGPLSPTLSPSEGERGNPRQLSGEPRFRGKRSITLLVAVVRGDHPAGGRINVSSVLAENDDLLSLPLSS